MGSYVPPFDITYKILDSISSIMEKIGKLSGYNTFYSKPNLRRNNRIKSIHASLAIENNSLSEGQVTDIIDGKTVLGPQVEILEVKNAYKAYKMIPKLNPYSLKDLCKAHGILTDGLIKESGMFRKGNEGVFDEKGNCIHMCPPPQQLDHHMNNIFDWMKRDRKKVHPLVMSSVFHYEFVFIHPFADGNGRTARLWQNVILSNWSGIFEYIPIESQIKKYQTKYYDAISKSHSDGTSTFFVEFMLEMIDEVLEEAISGVTKNFVHTNKYILKLLSVMENGVRYTREELMEKLGLKSRQSFTKNYLRPAMDEGIVMMEFPDKPRSRNQSYYRNDL